MICICVCMIIWETDTCVCLGWEIMTTEYWFLRVRSYSYSWLFAFYTSFRNWTRLTRKRNKHWESITVTPRIPFWMDFWWLCQWQVPSTNFALKHSFAYSVFYVGKNLNIDKKNTRGIFTLQSFKKLCIFPVFKHLPKHIYKETDRQRDGHRHTYSQRMVRYMFKAILVINS